jgi:hypothetical protein
MAALMVAACDSGRDQGAAGGAGTETGSPGMTTDTAAPPSAGAMDTASTDTAATSGTDTAAH